MTLSTATPGPQAMHRGHLRPLPGSHPAPGQRSLRLVAQQEGLLQVHTAPFRGSFSGVFSQALRSAGLGSRVLISQFLKGGVDQGLERSVWLCGRLQWLRPAVAGCLAEPLAADAAGEDHRAAVVEVWQYTREQLLGGQLDQLVLDELGLAVELGYLPEAEVMEALEQRPTHLDVILTGPSMPAALLALADQVTQLRRGF
ncbi:MAG: cob(I)yrinic acid a,c-diamide adenosyltransferase [Cyanobacteria bacterium REEB498]|nr:cob(I)yrinic acid a,c-diamide adenosyltransferase [Cyanobacteria bacterium REEB498]